MRTISAAIQFTGAPKPLNRPWTITMSPSATIAPAIGLRGREARFTWQGIRSPTPPRLLAPQGHVGIDASRPVGWNPAGDKRGGQKNQGDRYKRERISRAHTAQHTAHE